MTKGLLSYCFHLAALWGLALCAPALAAPRPAPSKAEDAVDRFIRAEMDKRHIPGLSLAIVKNGRLVKARGYGFADLEQGTAATPETVYDLGSIGKSFTATAVMILVERGRIGLDDKIRRHLPDLPAAWDDVRVRNLLNHTSGIPDYTSAPGLDWKRDYTPDELIALAAARPPHFDPGQRWRYVNTNYLLLDRIVEAVSGQTWDAFLAGEVFAPLGMAATRRQTQDVVLHRAAPYDGDSKTRTFRNTGYMSPTLFVNGSGGLLSTVLDLARWDAALYGDRIVKQSTLRQMWQRTTLPDGTVKNYGFGHDVEEFQGRPWIGHSGALPGYETHIGRFVDDKLTVILLTNRIGTGARELAGLVAEVYQPKRASGSTAAAQAPSAP